MKMSSPALSPAVSLCASTHSTASLHDDTADDLDNDFHDDDLDTDLHDDLHDDLEDDLADPDRDYMRCVACAEHCQNPRVLSCLHVACTKCLQQQLEGDTSDAGLTCAVCSQHTTVPAAGVTALPLDHVMTSLQDVEAVHERTVACTSCRARETAVARCSDCATFLCPNCVTAHRYMRCFENHKVLTFEELESADTMELHRPIFCDTHTTEELKYFCNTCQKPICSECVAAEHTSLGCHDVEPLSDVTARHSAELHALAKESRTKTEECEKAAAGLEGALGDLQMQRDNARSLIEETFHSYKAILAGRQEELLVELDALHSTQELGVMELCHGVERASERAQHACAFTDRLLTHGTAAYIARVRSLVRDRLLALINNVPRVHAGVTLQFTTDRESFAGAVKRTFGSFIAPDVKEASADISLNSPTDSVVFALPAGVLNDPAPLTNPLEGSTDDFLAARLRAVSVSQRPLPIVSAQTIKSIASSIQNLPASVPGVSSGRAVERSLSRSSYSPAMSDSGISVDAASSGSSSSQSLANLAALAKLRAVNINGHGQITFDGQVMSGLNLNGGSLPPGHALPRVITPPTPTGVSNVISSVVGSSVRPQTTQIAELANLLSQSASQIISASPTPSHDQYPLNLPGTDLTLPPPPQGGTVTPSTPSLYASLGPPPFPVRNNSKMSAMQIRCKFGQLGPGKVQFNSPHGFCLGLDEDIIVADTNNHRIQVFEKTGEFKYQFGTPGREEGQLWYPRKVAVIRQTGKYVVCDRGNERSRMQIFTKNGHFVKKIAIRYIDIVAGLAITPQGHIVAVDSVSPTVFCINETGDLIKWFDCSEFMREPSDIAINQKEYFVCDFKGHCVVVFNDDGQFLRRIGCENITNFPNGIDISDAGDVLIGDSHGNRFHVGVFQRDGSLIGEFECPYVKVSRCCGLKITSEGYVVTLAKNNHHVLVLNTLYIA